MIVFGIGNKGKIVAKELNNSEDINFLGVAVSKRYWNDPERKDYLIGRPVRIIDDYKKYAKDGVVILTTMAYRYDEIINDLKEIGFENFYMLNS